MADQTQRSEVSEGISTKNETAQAADKLREGLFVPMDQLDIEIHQITWGQLSDRDLAARNITTRIAKLEGAEGQRRDFTGGVATFRRNDGACTLILPPGSQYAKDSDGNITATDAKGKPLAEQRADGTMVVHTDSGSYIETRDRNVMFVPVTSHKPALLKERSIARAGQARRASKRAELRSRSDAQAKKVNVGEHVLRSLDEELDRLEDYQLPE